MALGKNIMFLLTLLARKSSLLLFGVSELLLPGEVAKRAGRILGFKSNSPKPEAPRRLTLAAKFRLTAMLSGSESAPTAVWATTGRSRCDPICEQQVSDPESIALHLLTDVFIEREVAVRGTVLAPQQKPGFGRFEPYGVTLALAARADAAADHATDDPLDSLRTPLIARHVFSW